ncbi:MAG: YchJ family protein [Thiotrichales bacterium]
MKAVADSCPCGADASFEQCCARFILHGEAPVSAEQLMRSRYSAYVRRDEAYLLRTWHPDRRPEALGVADDLALKWLGLTILDTLRGGALDQDGEVEFVARYKRNGKDGRIHERSRFERDAGGRWLYVDGSAG